MGRSRGGGGRSAPVRAPSRPAPASVPARAPQHSRPASTAVAPAGKQSGVPAQQQQQGGMGGGFMSNVASTAAGYTLGHAISGWFGGGSGGGSAQEPAPEAYPQQTSGLQANGDYQNSMGMAGNRDSSSGVGRTNAWGDDLGSGMNCGSVSKQLGECLGNNNGDMDICNYYLEQLKACKAAAASY